MLSMTTRSYLDTLFGNVISYAPLIMSEVIGGGAAYRWREGEREGGMKWEWAGVIAKPVIMLLLVCIQICCRTTH